MDRGTILETAKQYVLKDRNQTSGEPEDNFRTIANYWQTYLESKHAFVASTFKLTSKDVAAMMVLMKCSRLATSPDHEDHWIDIAGYAACGGGIATLQKEILPLGSGFTT